MKQPKDAVCANCKHHQWRIEARGNGMVYMSCFKHDWEGPLLPSTLKSATRDASIYCCTLWERSWKSRVQQVKRLLCK